ncbi:MAG: MBL fold metallo-hydrolase [Pseudomonadota bacterium]
MLEAVRRDQGWPLPPTAEIGRTLRPCHLSGMDGLQSKTAGKGGLTYPFGETTPDLGTVMEITPRVLWARMPLPFSLKYINVWLLDDGDSWTIIDTGMPLDETKQAWRDIFETTLGGRPVKRIIVTHMHPDHVGNAGWLSRKFPGADLWMSRLEYVSCRMLVADTGREAPKAGLDFYHRAGWNSEQIGVYESRFGGFGRAVSRMPDAYCRLQNGDTLEMAGETWQVMMGSGHSPEHACFYCAALNLFISGDQILPRISSNVSVFPTEPGANPLSDWLASCERLRDALPEDVFVLPGHNLPFIGAHKRCTHLIDGHETALSRLHQRLSEAPRRVIDTFPALFGRKIGEGDFGMATGEALAHINLLMVRGQATRSRDENGVDWYHAA